MENLQVKEVQKSWSMKFKTYFFTIVAIVSWGMSFVWTNDILNKGVPPFTFLYIRLALAGILLFLFSKLSGKLQKIDKKDWGWLVLLSFFEPFVYFIGETYGIMATGSGVLAAVIIATIPIFCIIAEKLIYRIPFTAFKIAGAIITIPGILMVVMKDGEQASVEHYYGIALLFMAVAASIGYSSIVKKLSGTYSSTTITTYQFMIGSMFFLPLFIGYGLDGLNATFFSKEVLTPILTLAILCSCICFICWANAIKHLGMTKTNVFSALIPAVSAVGAAALGQEEISVMAIIGIMVVIAGVIIAQKSQ